MLKMSKTAGLLAICLIFLLSVFGCITPTGQYRGALSGVEINRTTDGNTKINVSGNATVNVDKDGAITATSTDGNQVVLDALGLGR